MMERRFSHNYLLISTISVILIGLASISFYHLSRAPGAESAFILKNGTWVIKANAPSLNLKKDDILISINGISAEQIRSNHQIFSILKAGEKAIIKVKRNGKIVEVTPLINRRFKLPFLALVFVVAFVLISLSLYMWLIKPYQFRTFLLGIGSASLAILLLNFYPYLDWMRYLYFLALFLSPAVWIHITIKHIPDLFIRKWENLPLKFYVFSLSGFVFTSLIITMVNHNSRIFMKGKDFFILIMWLFVFVSALLYIFTALLPFILQGIQGLGYGEKLRFKFLAFNNVLGIIPIILVFYTIPELSHAPDYLKSSIYTLGTLFLLLLRAGYTALEIREEPEWLEEVLSKSRIYIFLLFLITASYFILAYLALKLIGESSFFRIFLYFLFFTLGILVFPIKTLLEETFKRTSSSPDYDFQEVIEKFNNKVFASTDPENLLDYFFQTVKDILKLKVAFLLMFESPEYKKRMEVYNLSIKVKEGLETEGEKLKEYSPTWGDIRLLKGKEESELLSTLSRDGIDFLLFIKRKDRTWGIFGAGTGERKTFLNPRDLAMLKVLTANLIMGLEALKFLTEEEGDKTLKLKELLESMEEERKKFEQDAYSDELTDIANRRYFLKALQHEIERSKRFEENISLLMIDVDNLKDINDTYGHLCGDRMLKHIAKTIQKRIRKIDILARYGGDEFALLLLRTGKKWASKVGEEIRLSVKKTRIRWKGQTVKATISIGVYATNFSKNLQETIDSFLEKADKALYMAKKEGKNKVFVYKETFVDMEELRNKETDIEN